METFEKFLVTSENRALPAVRRAVGGPRLSRSARPVPPSRKHAEDPTRFVPSFPAPLPPLGPGACRLCSPARSWRLPKRGSRVFNDHPVLGRRSRDDRGDQRLDAECRRQQRPNRRQHRRHRGPGRSGDQHPSGRQWWQCGCACRHRRHQCPRQTLRGRTPPVRSDLAGRHV